MGFTRPRGETLLCLRSVIPDARKAGERESRSTKGQVIERLYSVYILASRRNGTLYIGVTNNLARRVYEHRSKAVGGFTQRYDVTMLVWYEHYDRIDEAITREKMLKRWRRAWKLALIEAVNPEWRDLYADLA